MIFHTVNVVLAEIQVKLNLEVEPMAEPTKSIPRNSKKSIRR